MPYILTPKYPVLLLRQSLGVVLGLLTDSPIHHIEKWVVFG